MVLLWMNEVTAMIPSVTICTSSMFHQLPDLITVKCYLFVRDNRSGDLHASLHARTYTSSVPLKCTKFDHLFCVEKNGYKVWHAYQHARTVSVDSVLIICAVLVVQYFMCIITNTHTDTHALHWSMYTQTMLCVRVKLQMISHTHTDTHALHMKLSVHVEQQMIYHTHTDTHALHCELCMRVKQ